MAGNGVSRVVSRRLPPRTQPRPEEAGAGALSRAKVA
jgi:hypothetical protein